MQVDLLKRWMDSLSNYESGHGAKNDRFLASKVEFSFLEFSVKWKLYLKSWFLKFS